MSSNHVTSSFAMTATANAHKSRWGLKITGNSTHSHPVGETTTTEPATIDRLVNQTYSTTLLRLALGIVYVHFGFLKFFPDLSPAEMLASQTIMQMSFHLLDAQSAMLYLAILECAIGVAMLFNILPRVTCVLFLLHMVGTFTPLYYLPEFAFKIAPLAPTMEGQYILKNIVFVAAGWTVLLPQVLPRRSHQPINVSAA